MSGSRPSSSTSTHRPSHHHHHQTTPTHPSSGTSTFVIHSSSPPPSRPTTSAIAIPYVPPRTGRLLSPQRTSLGRIPRPTRSDSREQQPSPTGSSSPGDLADTEDAEIAPPQQPIMGEAPTKKKRTRMLLTPHQSAVLNNLFAESRFPTTATREEVGRSIGLSARKVQIWFQNQRQKAKRPRTEHHPSHARATHYGPFSTAPQSTAHSTVIPTGLPSAEPAPLTASPVQLSGPGMPGFALPSLTESPPLLNVVAQAAAGNRELVSPTSLTSSRYHPYGGPWSRPAEASPIEPDFSVRLPPLLTDTASHTGSRGPTSAPPGITTFALASGSATRGDEPYSPERPRPTTAPSWPPPFTLQPAPIWDRAMFAPPASLSHGRADPAARRGRSAEPYAPGRGVLLRSDPLVLPSIPRSVSHGSTLPTRSGRQFEPIYGADEERVPRRPPSRYLPTVGEETRDTQADEDEEEEEEEEESRF